jgi:preprotein translocase subunit SecA
MQKKINAGNTKEGFQLLRAYRALPKNKALINFLSEEGIKQLLQKTENQYMQDNKRDMHKIDEALYFVIEEKNNQVELTDNGIKYLLHDTDSDFCPSRHWN